MPELPEVETIARMLRPRLAGRTIAQLEVLWERIVDRPDVATFRAALPGAVIGEVDRRGKFLRLPLSNGQTLLSHLRMTGRFLIREAANGHGDDPHTRLRFRLDDGTWVIYADPRKFGRFYLVADPQEVLKGLGPEPLDPAFTPEVLAGRLAGRRGELKPLLLDQRIVAGLGNIYASEALWRAQLHPQRRAADLTPAEIARLHAAIVAALRAAVQDGGTSLGDRQYVYPTGELGQHQLALAVYERATQACPRCGAPIERTVLGQRSTYFCPRCQSGTAE